MTTTHEQAKRSVELVQDVGSARSIVDLDWVDGINVDPPKITVRLKIPDFAQNQRQRIAGEIRESLLKFDDIQEVQIELSNSVSGSASIGQAGHGENTTGLSPIAGVKKVIAVSSGKGGVGKSTVAVNLACALADMGLKIGLLDADIYGPNTPCMLGINNRTPEVTGSGPEQQIIPIETCGIGMVSMGLLIDEAQPVIWRGPMLNGIIRQFLYQAYWNKRDFLIVDLPPGTGDAQLSLAQSVPMAGVVIVTTPQNVSLQDSRRGLAMFRQMNVPVLGVVENMTAFIPPDQPDKSYKIFGSGGGMRLAEENNVPLLAQIPMEMIGNYVEGEFEPIVKREPQSITAKAFRELAEKVVVDLSKT